MKCAACHDQMVKKRGEIDLRIGGKLYLVRNVSYEECPACGKKFFLRRLVRTYLRKLRIENLLKRTLRFLYWMAPMDKVLQP